MVLFRVNHRYISFGEWFSLSHLNPRSINENLGSFENYLELIQYNFAIIGLTDTKLNNANNDLYGIHGYHFIEQHCCSLGAGVALYVMRHLHYLKRPDLDLYDNNIEPIHIEIHKDNYTPQEM